MLALQEEKTTLKQRYAEYKNAAKEIILEYLTVRLNKKKFDKEYTWKDINNYEYGLTTRELSYQINFEYGGEMLYERHFGFDADYNYNWSFQDKFLHTKDSKSFIRKLFRDALNELRKEEQIYYVRETVYLPTIEGRIQVVMKKYWEIK